MPYLTQVELEARVGGEEAFVKLTDDDGDDTPDAEVLETFHTELDGELDSYFRAGGYTVPLTVAQFTGVKRFALDIANFRLRSRGVRKPSETDRMLYEDAVGVMTSVAKRILLLDVVSAAATVAPVLNSNAILFDRETLATW